MLEIYAGKTALKTIQAQGFNADLFTSFLGASGGPKWFVLSQIDKYLFGQFFAGRSKPLNIMGSSIGAFRTACFCQQNPVDAIDRLIEGYLSVVYDKHPTPEQVTQSSAQTLDAIFGEDQQGISDIINNPIFKAHFFVAKVNGLVAYEQKLLQLVGLLKSYLTNKISRRYLRSQYQRYIFAQQDSDLTFVDPENFDTYKVALTPENVRDAVLASGCIPVVMSGITDIAGAEFGMYRDGGIIDYHFDIEIENLGLTLYPHFNSVIKPGWFDKKSKRTFHSASYDKTVVICPSNSFIQSLPYQKISDRTDFKKMTDGDRISYWRTIIKRSAELATELSTFIEKQDLSRIQPINILQK